MPDMEPAVERADTGRPLVTAVLVCWNHARFVRESVLSALQQTYRNVQVIVFDNGSTDGSRTILEALAKEYSFTLVCQENVGLVAALNRGLELAEGKYFATLATDDIWLPDKIERQVKFLTDNPDVQMICGNTQPIDEHGCVLAFNGNFRSGEGTEANLLANRVSVFGPTVLCSVDALRSVGGYDPRVRIEDFGLALRFASSGLRIVCRDELYARYRRHSGNWTSKPIWPDVLEMGRVYCSQSDYPYREWVRLHVRGYFRWLAGVDKREALRLLRSEPIAWTWDDVGVGLLKLLIPGFLLKWRRQRKALP